MGCSAHHGSFWCTLDTGHDGPHEAWGPDDLCATWTDRGKLRVVPEGDVGSPGALARYLDEVTTQPAAVA